MFCQSERYKKKVKQMFGNLWRTANESKIDQIKKMASKAWYRSVSASLENEKLAFPASFGSIFDGENRLLNFIEFLF